MKRIEPLEPRRLLTTLTLDPSFSGDGVAFDRWSPTWTSDEDRAIAIDLDASDRPVVVGQGGLSVVRYTTAGAPDPTFVPYASNYVVDDLLIQPDGKIVLARKHPSDPLIRLNTDGTVDGTFPVSNVSWELPQGISGDHRMVLTSDASGDLLLATAGGYTYGGNPNYEAIYVLRFSANGIIEDSGRVARYGNFSNWPTDIQTDAAGNVFVLGATSWYAYNGDYVDTDFESRSQTSILAKLNGNLEVDQTFGTQSGGLATPFDMYRQVSGKSLAIAPDGGLIVAGWDAGGEWSNVDPRAALWRFTASGVLDTTFGTNGVTFAPAVANASGTVFNDIALHAGKIVAVGTSQVWTGEDSLLGIYNLNGTPDTTFDGDGFRVDDLSPNKNDGMMALAIDGASRLLTAGYADRNYDGLHWSVARYTGLPGGTPPPSTQISVLMFNDANGDGIRTTGEAALVGRTLRLDPTPFDTYTDDTIAAVTDASGIATWTVYTAGRYVIRPVPVAGSKASTYSGQAQEVNVQTVGTPVTAEPIGFRPRTSNPQVDATFGTSGTASLDGWTYAARATSDGFVYVLIANQIIERRSLNTGALDTSFGTGGRLSALVNPAGGWIEDFLVLPDGKFLVASMTGNNVQVTRLLANGQRDTSFVGTNGIRTIDFGASEFYPTLAFGPNGTIVVAAASQDSAYDYRTSTGVARLLATGALDTTFDGDGIAVYRPNAAANSSFYFDDGQLLVQSDGKIVFGAQQSGTGVTLGDVIVRLNADGTLDTAGFGGGDGVALLPRTPDTITVEGLALDAAGRFVFVGSGRPANTGNARVLIGRLTTAGEFDAGFGTGGLTYLTVPANGGPTPVTYGESITVLSNGSILVTARGYITTGVTSEVVVARVSAAGVPDASFGTNGVARAALVDGNETPLAAFTDTAGRPVVVVNHSIPSGSSSYLTRFSAPVLASISGTLFNDLDNDGVKDANEPGIAGRTVYLDANNNGTYQSTSEMAVTTDANGVYRFESLAAGSYNVRQIVPSGWVQTRPQSGWTHTVTLTTGQQSTNNDLGVRGTAATTVMSSAFTFETAMRFTLTFDDNIVATLNADDVSVAHFATGFITTLPTSLWTLSVIGSTAIVTLSNAVPDANYQVRIRENGFAGSNGVFNSSPFFSPTFGVLAGDINRDRIVNFDDLLLLAKNYGKTGQTFSQGNVDYSADGTIGFDDLLVLAQRYSKSIPAAAAAADTAATAGSLSTPSTRKRSTASEIV